MAFVGGIRRSIELGLLAAEVSRIRLARSEQTADRARSAVAQRLGALRGLPQKMGQLLALAELERGGTAFAPLAETGPILTGDEFIRCCEIQWQRPVGELFAHVDTVGVAASLAQVHRATLLDGQSVAIKLLLPGVENDVRSDLAALGWLTAPVGGLSRGFDLAAYQREVRTILDEEMDFSNEAATLHRFGNACAAYPWIVVPRPVPHASSGRVLTMTWVDGHTFEDVRTWSRDEREAVAKRLLEFFLRSCLQWRILHGDPHPGNIRFQKNGHDVTLGILDFGCCQEVPAVTAAALRTLIAKCDGSITEQNALATLIAVGFREDLLAPIAGRLPGLLALLFEPFRENAPYDMAYWDLSNRMETLLGDDRWNFRIAGPPTLLIFIRAFQGLLQYLRALQVPISWRSIYDRVTADCHGVAATASLTALPPRVASGAAERLCIRVTENGRTRAQITFRAAVVENVADVIPDDVLDKLLARGIDPARVGAEAVENGLRPGVLFELEEEPRIIRVWLE